MAPAAALVNWRRGYQKVPQADVGCSGGQLPAGRHHHGRVALVRSDTLIARIDALSAVAEGVSPGDLVIQVEHVQDRQVVSGTGLQVTRAGGS